MTRSTSTPSAPSTTSAATGSRTSRRSRHSCSRGVDHSEASAANDTTSTPAAAAANTSSGIGRSARPTIPWAKTSTARESRNSEGPDDAGPSWNCVSALALLLARDLDLAGLGRRGRRAVGARSRRSACRRPSSRPWGSWCWRRCSSSWPCPRTSGRARSASRRGRDRLAQLERDRDRHLAALVGDLALDDALHAAALLREVEQRACSSPATNG